MQIVEALKQEAENATNKRPIRDIQNVVMPGDFANQLRLVRELSALDLVKIVTPKNYEAEHKAFLEGDCHPVFVYDENLLNEISSAFEDDGQFLWRKHNFADGTIRGLMVSLLENRTRSICCTAEFVSAMQNRSAHWQNELIREKYGDVDDDLAIEASLLVDELRFPEEHTKEQPPRNEKIEQGLALMQFDAAGVKKWFDYVLEEYGFEVEAEISEKYKFTTVNYDYDGIKVYIPKNLRVSGIRLLALIRHEIECRVRDFANSEALLRPFDLRHGIGRIDSDILTEGHAMLEEDKLYQLYFGTRKKPVPWYVLAIDLAREGRGFVEVASKIREYLTDCNYPDANELAWRYTYRVFRGSQNTFHARQETGTFVFTKDKAYLEGYVLAKALEEAGLSHWLQLGGLRPDELLEIASVVDFQPEDIPYKDKNVTDKVYRSLLSTLEQEKAI